jgi:hypothetical protein
MADPLADDVCGGLDGGEAGVAAVGVRLDRGLFLRRRPKRRPRDRRRRREETKAEAASWGAVVRSAVGICRRVVRKGRRGEIRRGEIRRRWW